MSATCEPIDIIREQLKLYEEQPEKWKRDHDRAMACREVEELIAFGNHVFGRISRLDEHWHGLMFREEIPYSAEFEKDLLDLYRDWLNTSEQLLPSIKRLELDEYVVDGAEQLRDHCEAIRSLLTPDNAFFHPHRLTLLGDEAIAAHRRGETEAIKELDD